MLLSCILQIYTYFISIVSFIMFHMLSRFQYIDIIPFFSIISIDDMKICSTKATNDPSDNTSRCCTRLGFPSCISTPGEGLSPSRTLGFQNSRLVFTIFNIVIAVSNTQNSISYRLWVCSCLSHKITLHINVRFDQDRI